MVISSHVTAILTSYMMSKFRVRKRIKERSIKNLIIVSTYNVVFLISHMWCLDTYFVTNTSLWCQNDAIRDEIRVIVPHMRKKKTILISCRIVFSPLRIHSLLSCLNTTKVWPYMVMWREIWISLITCNFAPFYPIEMGFSPEIIEFYAENYY